jgi:hypothetical protein
LRTVTPPAWLEDRFALNHAGFRASLEAKKAGSRYEEPGKRKKLIADSS